MRSKLFIAFWIGTACLLGVPTTQADTLVSTDSFTDVLTDLEGQPLRVDLFNPALGTLYQVTVTLSASLTSSGSVTNTSATPKSFTVRTRTESYTGDRAAGSPSDLPDPFEVLPPMTIIHSQQYLALPPGVPTAFGPGTHGTPGPLTILDSTNPAVLAHFLGVGQFGYDFNTIIEQSILGGGGNISASITTVTSATLTVTYDYGVQQIPVPEPGSLTLMCLGLGGLAAARRFKRNR